MNAIAYKQVLFWYYRYKTFNEVEKQTMTTIKKKRKTENKDYLLLKSYRLKTETVGEVDD